MHIAVQYDIFATGALIISLSAALLAIVTGIVLAYHWYRFSRDPLYTAATLSLFAAGCVLLLSIMFSVGPQLLL